MPPGGWIRRGMAVGMPLDAELVVLSEAMAVPVEVGSSVVVGAKTIDVGMLIVVAVSVAVGTIECGADDVVVSSACEADVSVVDAGASVVVDGATGRSVEVLVEADVVVMETLDEGVVKEAVSVVVLLAPVERGMLKPEVVVMIAVELSVAVTLDEVVVVTGTGMSAIPEEPVEVLSVYASVDVPVTDASVAVALTEMMVLWSAREEAALDSTLEYSDTNELDRSGSVAVAMMLEICELSDEATDDSAEEEFGVAAGTMTVPLPIVPLLLSESADETWDIMDGTTPLGSEAVIGAVVVAFASV